MVWFRVDDTLAFHRKALSAGNAAMGLWVRAGSQSSHELTEGRITTESARAIGTAAEIRRLVTAKLWHEPGHDCPDCPPIDRGYVYHDWCQANPSAEQVAAERAAAAERQRRARDAARQRYGRDNGVSHGVTTGDVTPDVQRESRSESRTGHTVSHGPPDPTRPDPGGGSLGGVTHPREGTREGTNTPPQTADDQDKRTRCMAHREWPANQPVPPCTGCKQAKQAAARADMATRYAAQQAIRACGLCDAAGWRMATLGVPGTPPCDHRPLPGQSAEPARGAGEYEQLRAEAQSVTCPTCPATAGQPCVDDEGNPLPRAPAHAARIKAARSVPA